MNYNAKNYTEQGGDVTHIGGQLRLDTGGEFVITDDSFMKIEAEGVAGPLIVTDGYAMPTFIPNQSASTATTVATLEDDFNALLTKLKSAGFMAADEPEDENGNTNGSSGTLPGEPV